MRYLTMQNLTISEGMGSQMFHVACLFAITKRTGHAIVFLNENNSMGKGLLVGQSNFPNSPILTLSLNDLIPDNSTVYNYHLTGNALIKEDLFNLDSSKNYNFIGLFHNYKIWYPLLEEVIRIYTPSKEIMDSAIKYINNYKNKDREIVSVHVRKGDYMHPINSFFEQMSPEYFHRAMGEFVGSNVEFLIFSDDIEWCKNNIGAAANITYSERAEAITELFAMSLCDHNIISNSSFGMWAAIFNKNKNKKIICPEKYFKSDYSIPGFNYSWYPDNFKSI